MPYTIRYIKSEITNVIRIALSCSDLEMKKIGEKKQEDNLVYFKTLTKHLDPKIIGLSPAAYALYLQGEAIQRISNLSLESLYAQVDAYSIHYIIHHYCEQVDSPKNGDIVVYPNPDETIHHYPLVGIFKDGTVISKYDSSSPYEFQHELFFIPYFYGDISECYRLRSDPVLPSSPKRPGVITPIFNGHFFSYTASEDTRRMRKFLDIASISKMVQFPQIERLKYIDFDGNCYEYAFGHLLESYKAPRDVLRSIGKNKATLLKYFDITSKPEKGDLVVYYDRQDNPTHYAIFLEDNTVISKWGGHPVYRHAYFDAPNQYKHRLRVLKLKSGLTKESLYTNLRFDESYLDSQPVLLFSYKKPIPKLARPRENIQSLLEASPSKISPKSRQWMA